MLDQQKFEDPEGFVTCPYDQVHQVTRKRIGMHLERCRKQHPDLAKELKTCYFNVQHKIPRPEFEFHQDVCPDRLTYHSAIYHVGKEANPTVTELMNNIKIPLAISSVENWDLEVNPHQQNLLEEIQKGAKERGILQNHSNEPPAVRKAKREEDRRRNRERINKEEQAKLNPRTFLSSSASNGLNVDDDSSVASVKLTTTKGTEPEASFKSAMDTTIHRLEEFQLVERKKRGRGRPKSPVTTVQAGLGRGRGMNRIKRL